MEANSVPRFGLIGAVHSTLRTKVVTPRWPEQRGAVSLTMPTME
jgi:hypothetical protein